MNAPRIIEKVSVAVIGGAGFLGSHCVDFLLKEKQCDVLVIDNLVTGRAEFINPKASFHHCDITGSESYLLKILKAHKTQYVWNYASSPYVPTSFERPLYTFDINAMGALKVINASQEAGVKGILQISSAEIYGNGSLNDTEGIDEAAEVCPHSSYGASKAAIDYLVQVRWRESKTPCIALRQFNALGERETHDYIVPTIISQLVYSLNRASTMGLEGDNLDNPTIKLGNNSFRDFLYAGDQASIAVELLEKGQFGQVYNLGSEGGIRIYDLAQMIGSILGFSHVVIEVDEDRVRPWEIWKLLSNNSKIYSVVDSRPQVKLEEALKRTIKYYRDNGCRWCWEK